MSMFTSFHTSSSALTAQRLRMDVVAANIANAETTRANHVDGQWQPYRRKMVVTEPIHTNPFSNHLKAAMDQTHSAIGNGVKVSGIVDDQTPFKLVYQPEHPDSDEEGYLHLPNVDPLREMVDLMGATRSYEANVTVLNGTKQMMMKALEIGK